MSSDHQKITARYSTEKHKRFFFPIRPLFTLGSSAFFGTLFLLSLLPATWAIIFTAAFAFDDLPLAPFIKLIRAVNNLSHGRKKLKSIVMITCISLATLIGGPLAFFILIHNPVFMLGMATFVFGTGCSPIWIFLGGIAGMMIADQSQKITPLLGISAGFSMGFLIGFSLPVAIIPPIISAIFISSITCAFIGSVIAKQSLRFYFYCKYGHSNADGYNMDRSPEEQHIFITKQAQKFNVSTEAFKKLTEHCKTKIAHIKEETSLLQAIKETRFSNPFAILTWCWDEFTLKRNHQTNAYKDIYHGLMTDHTTPENLKTINALLNDSRPSSGHTQKKHPNYPYLFSGERQSDLQARTFFHQTNLADTGGVSEDLIEPFLSKT
ncbi:MAG: hypothetical protein P1U61_08745 [Legionellaceae bacterium]|nr:hypothetical protein [Legionellaceae bacterium]